MNSSCQCSITTFCQLEQKQNSAATNTTNNIKVNLIKVCES